MAATVTFPFAPMEARSSSELPSGEGWQFEPKWDGFRCLAFRNRTGIRLQSKSGQPLERYFPDVVARLRALPATTFVLDGELVVPAEDGTLSFEDLLQRIHPAASRVAKLAAESPAALVVFDLLVDGRTVLTGKPLTERRARLERFVERAADGVLLSPATRDRATARRWLRDAGAGLDGVVAKRADAAYASGSRDAMVKVKLRRTADCVVGGIRRASQGGGIGSLLLGRYDDEGQLHHVGFTSSFKAVERGAVARAVKPHEGGEGFTGRAPGGPSRWSSARSADWIPLDPVLVVEVEYDHFSQGRFRHGTKFMRWRPDKAPAQCTFEQVDRRRRRRSTPTV